MSTRDYNVSLFGNKNNQLWPSFAKYPFSSFYHQFFLSQACQDFVKLPDTWQLTLKDRLLNTMARYELKDQSLAPVSNFRHVKNIYNDFLPDRPRKTQPYSRNGGLTGAGAVSGPYVTCSNITKWEG